MSTVTIRVFVIRLIVLLTSFPYFDHDTNLQLHPTFLPFGPWITLADQDRYRVGVAVADPLLGLLGGGNEENVVVACGIRHQRQCLVPNSITHVLLLLLHLLSLIPTLTPSTKAVNAAGKNVTSINATKSSN